MTGFPDQRVVASATVDISSRGADKHKSLNLDSFNGTYYHRKDDLTADGAPVWRTVESGAVLKALRTGGKGKKGGGVARRERCKYTAHGQLHAIPTLTIDLI